MVRLAHAPDVWSYLPQSPARARTATAHMEVTYQCGGVPRHHFHRPLFLSLSRWPVRPTLDCPGGSTMVAGEPVLDFPDGLYCNNTSLEFLLFRRAGSGRLCPDLPLFTRLKCYTAPTDQMGRLRLHHSDPCLLSVEHGWVDPPFVPTAKSV